jgi:hypothetical protein
MTSISSTSQNLQQGLENPEYLRVLNKSYPTERKDSKGMLAYEKDWSKSNFCGKAYYKWILTFNILASIKLL